MVDFPCISTALKISYVIEVHICATCAHAQTSNTKLTHSPSIRRNSEYFTPKLELISCVLTACCRLRTTPFIPALVSQPASLFQFSEKIDNKCTREDVAELFSFRYVQVAAVSPNTNTTSFCSNINCRNFFNYIRSVLFKLLFENVEIDRSIDICILHRIDFVKCY